MNCLTATQARINFFELIKNVIKNGKFYKIFHREGGVVVMPEEEYESLIETLDLLSSPNFKKKFKKSKKESKAGKVVSFDTVFGK
ncbi:MAG: type II toxin-antitoxin system Phd/YefM family antitoxin [Deltaproteobacteria bacterium]|nr:type II toxin-antitoxin system Phd/YefM family antitoxin [Deltaproteobacteria bacterium]